MPHTLQELEQTRLALAAAEGEKRSAFTLRMRRAISWLGRAQAAGDDDDVAFICLWIAFNSAYAQKDAIGMNEKFMHSQFIEKICELDGQGELAALIWEQYAGPIQLLLENRYVFQPFWDQLNAPTLQCNWKRRFEQEGRLVRRAMAARETAEVLKTVLVRLYTLRNQLMHGGATWGSSINRAQVRDGRAILGSVLPVMLALMMRQPQSFQAAPFYPVVK